MSKQKTDVYWRHLCLQRPATQPPSSHPLIFIFFPSQAGPSTILTLLLVASHPEGLGAYPGQTSGSDTVHRVWSLGEVQGTCSTVAAGSVSVYPRAEGCVCKHIHVHRHTPVCRGLFCTGARILPGIRALSVRTFMCGCIHTHMQHGTHVHRSPCLHSVRGDYTV